MVVGIVVLGLVRMPQPTIAGFFLGLLLFLAAFAIWGLRNPTAQDNGLINGPSISLGFREECSAQRFLLLV